MEAVAQTTGRWAKLQSRSPTESATAIRRPVSSGEPRDGGLARLWRSTAARRRGDLVRQPPSEGRAAGGQTVQGVLSGGAAASRTAGALDRRARAPCRAPPAVRQLGVFAHEVDGSTPTARAARPATSARPPRLPETSSRTVVHWYSSRVGDERSGRIWREVPGIDAISGRPAARGNRATFLRGGGGGRVRRLELNRRLSSRRARHRVSGGRNGLPGGAGLGAAGRQRARSSGRPDPRRPALGAAWPPRRPGS